LLTAEARLKAQAEAAKDKRQKTIETRQRFEREDVLLLHKRGLVPLAIADALDISLRRVVDYLRDAGETIPVYLTTWNEPPRGERCPSCGHG
jgi:DNA-directed RNA polymerase specialized sigma24 family protein